MTIIVKCFFLAAFQCRPPVGDGAQNENIKEHKKQPAVSSSRHGSSVYLESSSDLFLSLHSRTEITCEKSGKGFVTKVSTQDNEDLYDHGWVLQPADDTAWFNQITRKQMFSDGLQDNSLRQSLCIHCGKVFRHDSNRYRHQKMCGHGSLIPCPHCDQAFARTDNLKTHIQRVHGVGDQLVCAWCGKRFRSKIRLEEHCLSCSASS